MAKFIIDGDNKGLVEKSKQSEQALGKVGQAADKAGKDSSTSFLKMAASIATGTLAAQAMTRVLGGIKSQFLDVINKAGAQEQMTMRLAFAVSKLGVSWRDVRKEIEQYTANVQYKTGIGDDRQQDMLARLMMITGDYKKSLQLLVPTIGLAIESNRGFEETALAVGRAVSGFKEILGRYGVVIDDGLYKQDAFEAVMARIGPSADAASIALDTYKGKVEQLFEYIGDVKENIGLPIIERLAVALKGISQNDFENVLNSATKFGEKIGDGVEFLIAGIQTASDMLGSPEFYNTIRNAFGFIQDKDFWLTVGDMMGTAISNSIKLAISTTGVLMIKLFEDVQRAPKLARDKMNMEGKIGSAEKARERAKVTYEKTKSPNAYARLVEKDRDVEALYEERDIIRRQLDSIQRPLELEQMPEGYDFSSFKRDIGNVGSNSVERFGVNRQNFRNKYMKHKAQQDNRFAAITARKQEEKQKKRMNMMQFFGIDVDSPGEMGYWGSPEGMQALTGMETQYDDYMKFRDEQINSMTEKNKKTYYSNYVTLRDREFYDTYRNGIVLENDTEKISNKIQKRLEVDIRFDPTLRQMGASASSAEAR